ncbi:MAG TPA: hypothetical protein VHM88_13935, partial [Candidatus Acidoferrales bacterium]|nr:hypothetical protein [Candidatus Acidoferrales bacterium]
VSGRVPGGHNWELTWAAARDFITNMMPTNAVAVLVLGREREQRREFSQDKDKLLLEIEESEKETRRRVDSARGLESLIPETARSLSPAGWGDAIYVITYRGVSGVGRDRVSLDEQLAASGVRVFGLWLGDTLRPGPVGWRRRNETPAGLDRLARLSGGTVVSVDTELKREQVPMIVRPLYAAMTDVYRIEVEFERPVGRHDEWKLEVVDQQGYKLKGVEVAYPTLLVPLSRH